ncbi:hypothetical protein ACHFCA_22760 [Delftia tsuruhatensis]
MLWNSPLMAVEVIIASASAPAPRKAHSPAPVKRRRAGAMTAVTARAAPRATACTPRSRDSTSQNCGVWACAHSAMPVMATTTQGTQTPSLRAARASGRVSAAHSANSCQGSAPVW